MAKKHLIQPPPSVKLDAEDVVLIPAKFSILERVNAAMAAITDELGLLEESRKAMQKAKVEREKLLDEYARQAYQVDQLEKAYVDFVNNTAGYSKIPVRFLSADNKKLIAETIDHVPAMIEHAKGTRWYKQGSKRLQKWLENVESVREEVALQNEAARATAISSMKKRADDLARRFADLCGGRIRVNETHLIVAIAEIVPEVKRHFDLGWDGAIQMSVRLALSALGIEDILELTQKYSFGSVDELGKVTHTTKAVRKSYRLATYPEACELLYKEVLECRRWRADNKSGGKYPTYDQWLEKSGNTLSENAHPMGFDLNLDGRNPTPNVAGGDPSLPVEDRVEDDMGESYVSVSGNTLL